MIIQLEQPTTCSRVGDNVVKEEIEMQPSHGYLQSNRSNMTSVELGVKSKDNVAGGSVSTWKVRS